MEDAWLGGLNGGLERLVHCRPPEAEMPATLMSGYAAS
jgi:hypothetical protein